jgi:hypothetical protein
MREVENICLTFNVYLQVKPSRILKGEQTELSAVLQAQFRASGGGIIS